MADVNGDGQDDIIAFVRTNNAMNDSDVWVALSTGTGFGPAQKWHEYFCTLQEICAVGDMNGDGRDDIVAFVRTNNDVGDSDVWVALSTGTGFGPAQKWHDYFCTLQEICAVGDMNGDSRDDIVAFVRTNNGVGDSDVWVALSTGSGFGPVQKWHDYFCTLSEICDVGDFNGDGRDDVVTFVRDQANPNTSRDISLSISLYRSANTSAERAPYEAILEYFADAIYEMTNGSHRVGWITIWTGGQNSDAADVVWTANVWPSASASGSRQTGLSLMMADVFPFSTPFNALQSENARSAGYTLAHEWAHYFYGLYDEYQGSAPCDPKATTVVQVCDVSVTNSVMSNQFKATGGDFNWLNFSTVATQNARNANWRAFAASGWQVLARSADNDPKDGQRAYLPRRSFYPELALVAPVGGTAPSIELPDSAARSELYIYWYPAPAAAMAESAGEYLPNVDSPSGQAILYPEAARLVATLSKDNVLIGKADVSSTLTKPDGTMTELAFRDDGIVPDAVAGDGLYTTIMPYDQVGIYQVVVNFSNGSGLAEFTYKNSHFTPGPDGETFDPEPHPVGEPFEQQASTQIIVSGFDPEQIRQLPPTQLTADNHDYPGRIDMPGDKDSFTFTAEQAEVIVVRVTHLLSRMEPHIRIYQGDPGVLVGDYYVTLSSDRYFFTRVDVQAGEQLLIEVEHTNAEATEGLFNVSIGSPLLNTLETESWLFLPAIWK